MWDFCNALIGQVDCEVMPQKGPLLRAFVAAGCTSNQNVQARLEQTVPDHHHCERRPPQHGLIECQCTITACQQRRTQRRCCPRTQPAICEPAGRQPAQIRERLKDCQHQQGRRCCDGMPVLRIQQEQRQHRRESESLAALHGPEHDQRKKTTTDRRAMITRQHTGLQAQLHEERPVEYAARRSTGAEPLRGTWPSSSSPRRWPLHFGVSCCGPYGAAAGRAE